MICTIALARTERGLVTHVYLELGAIAFQGSSHQGHFPPGHSIEVDHFPLVLGAKRSGDSHGVSSLQESCFALGVRPKENQHAPGKVQLHADQVAVIG